MPRKWTIGVSFSSLFKLSKHEKDSVIFVVKLVKTLATKLSTQTRMSLTNTRLAKPKATGLPEGKIIDQEYVIVLKFVKKKEVLVSNDWGKMGRKLEELYW